MPGGSVAGRIGTRCRCGKVRGTNLDDARKLCAMVSALRGSHDPVRFYACTYGGWHWTRRDADRPDQEVGGSARRRAEREQADADAEIEAVRAAWAAEYGQQ